MNGLLLLDKPQGMTSHDVVYRVRRATGIREVGHAGTLDPMATGLLVMCVGKAVRLSEYLIGKDKTYAGRMKLGERTNTDDADGEVVERREVRATVEDLERVRAALTGDIQQVPPQFSAVQREGKRAYQMARKGEAVDLPSRLVRIVALELAPVDDGPRTTDDGFPEPTVVRRPSSSSAKSTCASPAPPAPTSGRWRATSASCWAAART